MKNKTKLFGTDGVRGVVNEGMTSELAYNLGKAIALDIAKHGLTRKVIIGKDTRVSGDLLAYSLSSGLSDYGVDAVLIDIVPTACVSYLSSKIDVGFAVMVTASHNVASMNGIKIMNNQGYKITKEKEQELEQYYSETVPFSETKGRIYTEYKYVEMYENYILNKFDLDLSRMSIALDTAFGSNYELAPKIFRAFGANVIAINHSNNGEHINDNCGAQHIGMLREEVLRHKCDIGFAFDGDADRLVVVDRNGKVLSGDELLFVFALYLKDRVELNSLTVVGTVMTNSGVEDSLQNFGIKMIRTSVGDRNVIECMKSRHYAVGGESSGHICLSDLNTTCDALMNSLFLLKALRDENKSLDDYIVYLKKYPQKTINVEVSKEFKDNFDSNTELRSKIEAIKNEDIRLVVRPSGTENVLRVMVESRDYDKMNDAIDQVLKLIN